MWNLCKCNCWLIIEVILRNARCNNKVYTDNGVCSRLSIWLHDKNYHSISANMIWRVRLCIQFYRVLTVVNGGDWLTSTPGCFIPGRERRYPQNMRLGRPQTQSGRFWRGICLSSTSIRSPDHWACSTVPIPGLANLWHTERFRWYATFTAVPIFFIFYPTIVSILWRTCVQVQ